ncbi:Caspase domain-containing protein [Asanoa hainanensis]|uniref:Caspase domain-containing protein n=1 Tax=Asanoa hainanensis TaxID=560556 RepID=A0A239PCC0_9ACTN|nr:caspase family protein [Asanoa hainanensis]SNT64284.1 Caspase domain-containing protein [Asanoa hainanensis]
MRLPEFERSRAVLVGTATYASDNLDDLPAVAENVNSLEATLLDTRISGFHREFCSRVLDPRSPDDLLGPIYRASQEAEDVLLVYYAGHGLLEGGGRDLYLSLTTSKSGQFWTSVPFDHVSRILLGSRAAAKIVILDCCYSGRALGIAMSDPVAEAVSQLKIEGLYIVTSCSGTKTSLSPEGSRHTAFTGALVSVMHNGVKGSFSTIPMDLLYENVRALMQESSLHLPEQRIGNTSGKIALVRNVHKTERPVDAIDGTLDDLPVGQRIQHWRQRRGLSGRTFSKLIGRSESWVSRVESGRIQVDKLTILSRIAIALSIDLPTLIGKDLPRNSYVSYTSLEVDEIRARLEQYPTFVTAHANPPGVILEDEMQKAVSHAWKLLGSAAYPSLCSALPAIIRKGMHFDAAPDNASFPTNKARLLCEVYQITSLLLRNLGEHELAWVAGEKALAAARRSGDELLVGMALTRVGRALLALGRARPAFEVCLVQLNALGETDASVRGKHRLAVTGALLLDAAMAAARIGDSATLRELFTAADEVGGLASFADDPYYTNFNTRTIDLVRSEAEVELGEGKTALQIHDTRIASIVDRLPRNMQGAHFLAMARASLHIGDVTRALAMVLEVDKRAPFELTARPLAHEVLGDLYRRSNDPPTRFIEIIDEMGLLRPAAPFSALGAREG